MTVTDAKFLVGTATFASLVSIGTVLIVVPGLYSKIHEIQGRINDGVKVEFIL